LPLPPRRSSPTGFSTSAFALTGPLARPGRGCFLELQLPYGDLGRACFRSRPDFSRRAVGSSLEVSVPYSAPSRSNRRPSHRMGPSPLGLSQTLRGFVLVLPCCVPLLPATAARARRVHPSERCSSRTTCAARRVASPARPCASETAVTSSTSGRGPPGRESYGNPCRFGPLRGSATVALLAFQRPPWCSRRCLGLSALRSQPFAG